MKVMRALRIDRSLQERPSVSWAKSGRESKTGMREEGDLVDELAAEGVSLLQDFAPEVTVHALHHIACLYLEQAVSVGAVHQCVIALAPLVRHARQVGIPLLAVLAHLRTSRHHSGIRDSCKLGLQTLDLAYNTMSSYRHNLAHTPAGSQVEEVTTHAFARLDIRNVESIPTALFPID